jgi:2-polyprenyl-3-methyl-5-hydroxy-6-metoxy-1,4-benzoquinol methylase
VGEMGVGSSQQIRDQYTRDYYLGFVDDNTSKMNGVGGWKEFSKGEIAPEKVRLANLLPFRGRLVLDVGFGRGEIISHVLANGATKVVGVDYSVAACEIADEFLRKKNQRDKVILYNLPVVDFWTIEEKDFEIIYLLDVLEHIKDWEIFAFLSQLQNKVMPESLLLASTPAIRCDFKEIHCNY